MNELKEKIRALRVSKTGEDRRICLGLLEGYLAENPRDSEAWYDKACCHDFLGEEQAAEPCYGKTYELGWQEIPAEEQKSFFVGYGSTLRNNLKFEESISLLREGIREFPGYAPLKLFLALSLYSVGRDREAAEILFPACLEAATQGLDGFAKPLQYYVEHLRDWPEARGI